MFLQGLGTLSTFPREVRDKIYGYALGFATRQQTEEDELCPPPETCTCKHKAEPPRTSLLQVSKRIHDEAEIVLYQISMFGIWLDFEVNEAKGNKSVSGQRGYRVDFGLLSLFPKIGPHCFMDHLPRPEMLAHMQYITFTVGTRGGLMESDIVPLKGKRIFGPQRPAYRSLVEMVNETCEMLKTCHQIQLLRVFLRSIEMVPGSIEKLIDPIRSLRRIKKAHMICSAMEDDQWIHWSLKGSYKRYLTKIMAMPDGTIAPKYVGDEEEPNQNDKDIFERVGKKFPGGMLIMPAEDDEGRWEDDDDERRWEDDDDEEGGFQMFMNAMEIGNYDEALEIANGPLGPGFPISPAMAMQIFDDSFGPTSVFNDGMPMPGYNAVDDVLSHLYGNPAHPENEDLYGFGYDHESETRSVADSLD